MFLIVYIKLINNETEKHFDILYVFIIIEEVDSTIDESTSSYQLSGK